MGTSMDNFWVLEFHLCWNANQKREAAPSQHQENARGGKGEEGQLFHIHSEKLDP